MHRPDLVTPWPDGPARRGAIRGHFQAATPAMNLYRMECSNCGHQALIGPLPFRGDTRGTVCVDQKNPQGPHCPPNTGRGNLGRLGGSCSRPRTIDRPHPTASTCASRGFPATVPERQCAPFIRPIQTIPCIGGDVYAPRRSELYIFWSHTDRTVWVVGCVPRDGGRSPNLAVWPPAMMTRLATLCLQTRKAKTGPVFAHLCLYSRRIR